MGATATTCKLGGYLAMRFISLTPRMRAALAAVPIAAMAAILAPVALRGGIAELLALASVVVAVKCSGNDLAATALGLAELVLGRTAGL